MASFNLDDDDGPCSRLALLAFAGAIAVIYRICQRFCRDDGSDAPGCPCKLLALLLAMVEFLWIVFVCGIPWPQARRRARQGVPEPERT